MSILVALVTNMRYVQNEDHNMFTWCRHVILCTQSQTSSEPTKARRILYSILAFEYTSYILRSVSECYSRGTLRLRLTKLALFCKYGQTCDKSIACVFPHKIVTCLVEGKERQDCRTEQRVPGRRGLICFFGDIAE